MTKRTLTVTDFFFGPYYDYLKRLAPLIVLTFFLFVASLVMGFLLGDKLPTESLSSILSGLPKPSEMNGVQLFVYIFANNAGKSLIFMFSGLLLGVIPLVFVVINGFVVGWVCYELSQRQGLLLPLVGLGPHGVIEIPALLLSMAIGMSLGYHLVNQLRGRGGLSLEVGVALRFFISRIAPAFFLAAVIEVTVTPVLLQILF